MNPDLFLACVGDATRAGIVRALRDGPATVNDLVDATGHSQSNVSHHLARLRECGLVSFERVGKANQYTVHAAVVDVLDSVDRAADALADLCICKVCQ